MVEVKIGQMKVVIASYFDHVVMNKTSEKIAERIKFMSKYVPFSGTCNI